MGPKGENSWKLQLHTIPIDNNNKTTNDSNSWHTNKHLTSISDKPKCRAIRSSIVYSNGENRDDIVSTEMVIDCANGNLDTFESWPFTNILYQKYSIEIVFT